VAEFEPGHMGLDEPGPGREVVLLCSLPARLIDYATVPKVVDLECTEFSAVRGLVRGLGRE
jgi:hypothetical protein